jgi:hypothetical protein
MRRSHLTGALALLAMLVVAALAATVRPAEAGTSRAAAAQPANSIQIRLAVTKFAARGKHLVAIGQAIATYQTTDGVYSSAKPFTANVVRIHKARTTSSARSPQASTRICDVLSLTLGPLHLELLGLIVDLNRVVLTIKADSNGGLLGSLLCGLAGGAAPTPTAVATTATRLTQVAKTSGLAASQPLVTVPLQAPSAHMQQAAAVCTVLDLTLGPLDLNLLGLMVHLGGGATGTDPLHLTITADPTKGLLGSLLCGLAGGLPTG